MIPIPGRISKEELAALLSNIVIVSMRTQRPLIARLLPIPGKAEGEYTEFGNADVINSSVMGFKGIF
jgi:uncharacterized protein (UPF0210 family)